MRARWRFRAQGSCAGDATCERTMSCMASCRGAAGYNRVGPGSAGVCELRCKFPLAPENLSVGRSDLAGVRAALASEGRAVAETLISTEKNLEEGFNRAEARADVVSRVPIF